MTLAHLLVRQATVRPDVAAVFHGTASWATHGQWAARCAGLAQRLHAAGLQPGDRLDLNEHLIRNAPATFICQADAGSSMVDLGIDAGDLLVVDRSIEARHGHIVVALWDGGFTLKQLWIKDDRVELRASAGHQPLRVGEGVELEIWGVVLWSIRRQVR